MNKEEREQELEEKTEDLDTFMKARDVLYKRLLYVKDHSTSFMPLSEWAGAHAIMNMLDVVINDMERLVQEIRESPMSGEVTTKPKLRVVKNEESN